jgi:hypothetical protein
MLISVLVDKIPSARPPPKEIPAEPPKPQPKSPPMQKPLQHDIPLDDVTISLKGSGNNPPKDNRDVKNIQDANTQQNLDGARADHLENRVLQVSFFFYLSFHFIMSLILIL